MDSLCIHCLEPIPQHIAALGEFECPECWETSRHDTSLACIVCERNWREIGDRCHDCYRKMQEDQTARMEGF